MEASGSVSVVTVGETMGLLDPREDGMFRPGVTFQLRVGGAESNFAIALARLGVSVAWISRLGSDPIGDAVLAALSEEAVDLSYVKRIEGAPTGIYFKLRERGAARVFYYRRGSAATGLEPGDVPDSVLDTARLVHLTGITMALGESARATVIDTARRARARGAVVTFDPNWRAPLWASPDAARRAHQDVLAYVDWYLCGVEEGALLFDCDRDDLAKEIVDAGPSGAVVRIGAGGALVHSDGRTHAVSPDKVVGVLDDIGAGDGFAAGFAYGILNGWNARQCTHAGNVIAGAALAGTGDWETYPRIDEVRDRLTQNHGPIARNEG